MRGYADFFTLKNTLMQITIKEEKTLNVSFLQVSAGVRYWEDATVNGKEDTDGDLIPCRNGDYWEPRIDVNTGKILNWTAGTTADIHYKICDDGKYSLIGENQQIIKIKEGYVPDIMCPGGEGYGDYIIMKVDENGIIAGWEQTLSGFSSDSDD
jgi:hypothetical protein